MSDERWRIFVSKIFKKDGKPYVLTDGQLRIFCSILDPNKKHVCILAPSRYGKTEVASLAILVLASLFQLKIPIIGGTISKSKKIMEYILEHISDHPSLYEGLIDVSVGDIESLKVMKTKTSLRWKNGGWIYVSSLEERNTLRQGESVVGEGGDMIFVEEAGLLRSDEHFSKVVRMREGEIGKIVLSGNAFENSVFERAFRSDLYEKCVVSLEEAFSEGRLEKDRVFTEIKPQMTKKDWMRFYECEFPSVQDYSYFYPRRYEALPPIDELYLYGAIDPSLGEVAKQENRSLAGVVVLGVHKKTKQAYEVFSEGSRLNPTEMISFILDLPYRFTRFAVEDVQYQRYFKSILEDESRKRGKYIPFVGVRQTKAKRDRIESIEPYINTGQVLFRGGNELEKELREYPFSDHLDVLDALEMAIRVAIGGASSLPLGQTKNTKSFSNWKNIEF